MCTHVVIFFFVCSTQRCIFSNPINVAEPTLLLFRNSTHFCALLMVSTTMWSRAPQAVEIATSNLSSMAPKSPYDVTDIFFIICTFWKLSVLLKKSASEDIIHQKTIFSDRKSLILIWTCSYRIFSLKSEKDSWDTSLFYKLISICGTFIFVCLLIWKVRI